MRRTRLLVLLGVLGAVLLALPFRARIRGMVGMLKPGTASVDSRVRQYGDVVRARLAPDFVRARVAYPPTSLTLVALKHEAVLQVYAGDGGAQRFIRAYPILCASGRLGPKLAEGDMQVPEGVYGCESLNPNSAYHLALRVDYPNADDRRRAAAEGRTDLGGDIMIHGGAASIGCLAMGDPAAEDLFVLAALAQPARVRIIISPLDFRTSPAAPALPTMPPWIGDRYAEIRRAMGDLPPAP
jgi:hypothetical protein